eukprot:scaffold76591_cov51-Prasinocladus_malaysianus.AAC.2
MNFAEMIARASRGRFSSSQLLSGLRSQFVTLTSGKPAFIKASAARLASGVRARDIRRIANSQYS